MLVNSKGYHKMGPKTPVVDVRCNNSTYRLIAMDKTPVKPIFFRPFIRAITGYNSIYNDHRASFCKNDGRKNGLVLGLSWGDTDTPDTPDTPDAIHTCPGKILESERHT